MKIAVNAEYPVVVTTIIELPEGVDWERDVEEMYVKWNKLHYIKKGDTEFTVVDLSDEIEDAMNWKRPLAMAIHGTLDVGGGQNVEIDWDNILEES